MVLDGVEERKKKRQEKWELNAPKRAEKGMKVCLCPVVIFNTKTSHCSSSPLIHDRMTVRIEIKMKLLNWH